MSCRFLKYLETLSSKKNGDGSKPPIPGTPTLRNRTFTSITLQWEPVNTTNGTSVYLIAVEFEGDFYKSSFFINTVRTQFRISFFLKFSRPTCQFIYSHLFLSNFLNLYHSVRVLNTKIVITLHKQLHCESTALKWEVILNLRYWRVNTVLLPEVVIVSILVQRYNVLRATCMIASSTYELALKCPECVNLHTEFLKDPFWNRPY